MPHRARAERRRRPGFGRRPPVFLGLAAAALIAAGAGRAAGQAPPLERVGTIPGAADVMVAGAHLLVAGGGASVRVVDVSRPEAPLLAGRYDFEQPVLGLALGGAGANVVYVANSHDGLRRLDLMDPSAPRLSGTMPTRGQAVGVAATSRYVFVGDNSLGFDIVDTEGDLRRIGEYLGDGFPRDVAAAGSLVYVADQPAGLVVVDVSDPAAPAVKGGLSLGREPVTGVVAPDARSWDAGQPPVAVIASGTAGLQVVDVSDPAAPAVTAPLASPGGYSGVAMWADRVFVAGDGVLRVFDVANPGRPVLVAESDLGGEAGAVAVSEALVFVAVADQIVIFRYP